MPIEHDEKSGDLAEPAVRDRGAHPPATAPRPELRPERRAVPVPPAPEGRADAPDPADGAGCRDTAARHRPGAESGTPYPGHNEPTRIVFTADGPALVDGPVELVTADGEVIEADRFLVAICLCKRSRTYPLCDTSHRRHRRCAD